jgi:hypothetical protein
MPVSVFSPFNFDFGPYVGFILKGINRRHKASDPEVLGYRYLCSYRFAGFHNGFVIINAFITPRWCIDFGLNFCNSSEPYPMSFLLLRVVQNDPYDLRHLEQIHNTTSLSALRISIPPSGDTSVKQASQFLAGTADTTAPPSIL